MKMKMKIKNENKNEIQKEENQKENENSFAYLSDIKVHQIKEIMIIVCRKLCLDKQTQNEISRVDTPEIIRLAEIRTRDILEAIVSGQNILHNHNKNEKLHFNMVAHSPIHAAERILENVFGIESPTPF